jgi:hypothetical protein
MKRAYLSFLLAPLLAATAIVTVISPSSASVLFGTLSHFDVFNDTGQECHGFEIELDGLASNDITYEFSSTFVTELLNW